MKITRRPINHRRAAAAAAVALGPPATGDSYHYHGVPYCITDVVDVDQSHSTMIGVLLD